MTAPAVSVPYMRTLTLPPSGVAARGTGALPAREHLPAARTGTVLDVVIPVYNEEADLERCVRRLHAHLAATFPYGFRITVADNASTDRTPAIAQALEEDIAEVTAVRLEQKGRGRALRAVWLASDAPVLAYMDVDLSTDLNALLPLVAPLISGHSDLAIGSRLARSSRVVRGPKREFISRSYNLILRGSLAARFSDAQCGFKAIRGDVAQRLLPMVEDTGWFFDTEMLVLAERAGLRIHEVPVDWVDDPHSSVHIVRTATDDLRGVWRVGRALATGALPLDRLRRPFGDDPRDRELSGVPTGLARQLVGFAVVGALSTVVYLALYSLFRTGTGPQAANALALLLSAIGNTAANRRLTFGVRGRDRAVRHQAQGLVVFAIGLAMTSGSLAALRLAAGNPSHTAELVVLIAANLAATVVRFLLLRAWVFPGDAADDAPEAEAPEPAAAAAARDTRDTRGTFDAFDAFGSGSARERADGGQPWWRGQTPPQWPSTPSAYAQDPYRPDWYAQRPSTQDAFDAEGRGEHGQGSAR